MKCPICDGDSVITFSKMDKNGYFNDAFFIKECSVCHGTGEVQTNEEWFDRLSTETKARITHLVYMAGYRDGFNGAKTISLQDIMNWFKQPHRQEIK